MATSQSKLTGRVLLGESCEIVIREGSSLTLYLDGNLEAKFGAGINNYNDPPKFTLYGTSSGAQDIDLRATGDFRGSIYAPNADLIYNAEGDFYGAVVVDSFEQKFAGNFYYDEALRDVDIYDVGVRFVIKRWSE